MKHHGICLQFVFIDRLMKTFSFKFTLKLILSYNLPTPFLFIILNFKTTKVIEIVSHIFNNEIYREYFVMFLSNIHLFF